MAPWVDVDSAGTHGDYHQGEPPDARSCTYAVRRGYDISSHRARPVIEADFACFDLILAMDEANLTWLREACPAEHRHKIQPLLAYATGIGEMRFVPDPYYGSVAGFEAVLDLVEAACDGLIAHLVAIGSTPSQELPEP